MQILIFSGADQQELEDKINLYVKDNKLDVIDIKLNFMHHLNELVVTGALLYRTPQELRQKKIEAIQEKDLLRHLFNSIMKGETEIPQKYVDEINEKFWDKLC